MDSLQQGLCKESLAHGKLCELFLFIDICLLLIDTRLLTQGNVDFVEYAVDIVEYADTVEYAVDSANGAVE